MNVTILRHLNHKIQGRDALQHEWTVVSIVGRFQGEFVSAKIFKKRVTDRLHRVPEIFPTFDLPAFGMTRAIICIKNSYTLLQLRRVCLNVCRRANESFFLATPQGKSNRSTRSLTESSNGTCHFHDHCRTCAIVLRTGTEVPGIEVSADQDPLVWMIAAWYFSDHVVNLRWATGLVFKRKFKRDRAMFHLAANQLAVFHAQLCRRNGDYPSTPVEAKGIQNVVGDSVGNDNRESTSFFKTLWRIEQIVQLLPNTFLQHLFHVE